MAQSTSQYASSEQIKLNTIHRECHNEFLINLEIDDQYCVTSNKLAKKQGDHAAV